MRHLFWLLWLVLLLGAAAFVGFKVFERQIGERLFERAVSSAMERNDLAGSLVDGLHVFMCGAGSPMADPKRGGPCLAVAAGDHRLVFDAGTNSARTLARMRFPVGAIDHVFLTHLHSDHLDGLGELMFQRWVGGNRQDPLPVNGPRGTARVVRGFVDAYRIDSGYRTAHHGEGIAPPSGYGAKADEITMAGTSEIVLQTDDLTVTAFPVSHAPVEPAFGYRIDYKTRSIVVSGDTYYDVRMIEAAKDADVLVHDALQPRMVEIMAQAAARNGRREIAKIFGDILDYHASPEDAAEIAQKAGVKRLILTHIVPPLPTPLFHAAFLGDAAERFDGPITIARDGMVIHMPVKSDIISVRYSF